MNILIVEDTAEEREIFSRYLQFVGGGLLEARNGEEGLKMAREHRPDLILLDLTMPVMDGWELMAHLKREPGLAQIPVVAVTAHHLSREALEAKGFCGYLEKPLAPYRVLEEVERCLGPISRPGGMRPGEQAIPTIPQPEGRTS